jgi:hypothetical protein
MHRVNRRVRGLFFHVSNKSKPTHSLCVMISGYIHVSNLTVRGKHVRNFLLTQIKRQVINFHRVQVGNIRRAFPFFLFAPVFLVRWRLLLWILVVSLHWGGSFSRGR